MRHINRRRGNNSWWNDPDDIITEPYEQGYVNSYRNSGFKNASNKNTYVKFLRYIADNPGSTRKEILDGLGRLKGAADGGRGQNSSLFSQLLYLDLIDYDDKFKYFITDKGEEVLEKADKNDEEGGDIKGDADEGPDSAMESTRRTMKKLNITKERFEKSRYFQKKYGKLKYVSESGKVFKTNKGKVLMFKESQPDSPASDYDDENYEGDESNHESVYGKIVAKHAEALWDAIWALRKADSELMEKTGKPLIDEEAFKDIHNCRVDLYMELAPYLDEFLYSYEEH